MTFQTPTLVQQTAAASTSLNPASFAPAFGGATTAGNLLVALVSTANSSAAPTITTPAGWTLIGSSNLAAVGLWAYAFPANTGGITTVTFAGLTNINAISVSLLEFAGMPATIVVDPQTGGPAIFPLASPSFATSASAASLTSGTAITPKTGNGLWLALLACNATGTITNTSTPSAGLGAWNNGTAATSTTGTTNIKTQSLYSIPGPGFPSTTIQAGGSWGGSVFCAVLLIDFLSLSSGPLSQNATGNPGGAASWTSSGAGQAVGV